MNRAQSETVGFILVFALIAVSTGVVYVAGFSTLDDARTAEEIQNMERAFDVFDDGVDDVAREGAPGRSTEIRLGNGDVAFGDRTRINVSTNVTTDTVEIHPRPVVYRLDGTELVYSNDAVLRDDRGSAVMRSEPAWVVNDRRVVLPLIDVDSGGDRVGVGGDSTTLIQIRQKSPPNARTIAPESGRVEVTVTVESPRVDAWERLLRSHGFGSCSGSGRTISCSTDTDELHVVWTTVRIEFAA